MEDLLTGYTRLLYKLPEWLGKPLGLCAVCFTGQLTLWAMLPFVRWTYMGVIEYVGVIAINMIIVKLLMYVEKD